MRLMNAAGQGAGKAFPQHLLTAALLLSLIATGCNNTCVSFTSNPPTGTLVIKVSDAKPTCTFSKANGAVRVQLSASPMPDEGSTPWSPQHILVSLRGIEAHPSAIADDASPDWQELAPKLAQQPMQVDLMARTAGSCASDSFGEGTVPAGVYHQIRLRLVPNQPGTSEPVPRENACGVVGFNCMVMADGNIRPLALDGAAPELPIASEGIAGGFFHVLPDAGTDLAIKFSAQSSLSLPAGNAVRLVPAFSVALRAPCPSLGGSEP